MTARPLTILIADDDEAILESLQFRCERLGLRTITASDGCQAVAEAVRQQPDFVCLDVHMPGGNGLSAAELIGQQERLSSARVIILTGSTAQETVRRCHRMCAYYLPKTPGVGGDLETLLKDMMEDVASSSGDTTVVGQIAVDQGAADAPSAQPQATVETEESPEPEAASVLETSVEAGDVETFLREDARDASPQPSDQLVKSVFHLLMGDREEPVARRDPDQPPWALVIEDDQDSSWALKLRLEARGVTVVRAFDGDDGYNTAFAYPADVILLDYEMPHGCGDVVLEKLKSHPLTKDIPVIMVTGCKRRGLKRKLLRMGAEAFYTKPVYMPKLLRELDKHISLLPWSKEERAPLALT